MKQNLYIPFSKILKEFKKSAKGSLAMIFLCHRSETFKKLWDGSFDNQDKIRRLGGIFLTETGVTGVNLHLGSCLFTGHDDKQLNKIRVEFILWGVKENRKNKLRKI